MEFAESGVISLRPGRMSAARRLRSADRALRRSPEVALRVLTSPQKNLVASRRARGKCRFQGAVRDIMGATMLASRGTRVRLAIAAAASFIVAALFLVGGNAPRDAAMPQGAKDRVLAVSEQGSRSRPPAELPALAAESLDSAGVASGSETVRPSHSLPRWARDALEVDDATADTLRTNLDPRFSARGLDPRQLAVLGDIIAISGLSEASSPFDYDDGDGVLEPWELGFQVWENGSLVLLAMGPSSNFFGRTRSYSSGVPIVG